MAFQALRRAAGKPERFSALRHLVQQQPLRNGAMGPATQFSSSEVNSAGKIRSALGGTAFRAASTAKEVKRDSDSGLLSVLRTELDHERKTYRRSKEVSRGPPTPWQMTERPGYEDIILRRSYGQEDIAVACVYQADHEYDEQGEDYDDVESGDEAYPEETGESLSMIITINKGSNDPTLEIRAGSSGKDIAIENVALWEPQIDKETCYQGPNFFQLDEELKDKFEKYIRARGINKDFAGFLFSALADKEQQEYVRWLQNMEAFVKL